MNWRLGFCILNVDLDIGTNLYGIIQGVVLQPKSLLCNCIWGVA